VPKAITPPCTTLSGMSNEAERVCIHGRVFQKISVDERIYCVPIANDDVEEDRLTAQHALFCRLLGNALVSPMIRLREPTKVLDCGYGGGDWCVQFAEEFEDCEVCSADALSHGVLVLRSAPPSSC
jgi:hypothetical protein